jgi:hypothetical protein
MQSTPPKPVSPRSILIQSSHLRLGLPSGLFPSGSVPRLWVVIRNKYWVLRWGLLAPAPNPQAGGPPTVGCPRLRIRYIRSYPPYLKAVSSIRNPRTRHAVVTVDPLNVGLRGKLSNKALNFGILLLWENALKHRFRPHRWAGNSSQRSKQVFTCYGFVASEIKQRLQIILEFCVLLCYTFK